MFRQNPGHLVKTYIYRDWEFIHTTRRFLSDIIFGLFKDRKYRDRVASAAEELIENAYKFSPVQSDIGLILMQDDELQKIVLKVSNYIDGDPQQAFDTLKQEIDFIYSSEDPRMVFKEKILHALANENSKDMLGLCRIRMETNATLDCQMNDEGLLTISAFFPMDK